jgi:SAM-dependent methyltransferase
MSFDMKAHAEKFWDKAHQRGSGPHVRPKGPHRYTEYFELAGPFQEDVNASSAVLDIGPGMGQFLDSLEGKEKYAIDVSSVSRERTRRMGGQAFEPGKIGAGVVDLATCLSVVQHCDLEASRLIFSDASRALRPGGLFYLNAIHGVSKGEPMSLLSRGRFAHDLDELIELAGFSVAGKHTHRVGNAHFWILRLVK